MSQRQVMSVNMILADADPVYTAILAARLQTKLPHVKISRCNDPAALRAAIAQQKSAGGPALFLYNAADFHELKHLSTADIWPASWQARPLLADRHWQNNGNDDLNDRQPLDVMSGFCRFDPVSSLVDQLQAQFDLAPETKRTETSAQETSVSKVSKPENTAAAVASEHDIPVDRSGLRLLLSVAATGHDPAQARQCLNDLVSHGHQVFYLPLMPTYQMTHLVQPAQGPNLSDLLMHLVGQGLTHYGCSSASCATMFCDNRPLPSA